MPLNDTMYNEAPIMTAPSTDNLPDYLTKLNPEQREAVMTTEGPLLVLAGAGTGKTRVLISRIAHIIMQKKAFAGQILSVTFTNKAAGEMRERVEALIGGETFDDGSPRPASGVWLGTFHSIGAKMLRRHAELLGFKSDFTILDSDDQHRLIKQIMEEQGIDHKKQPGKVMIAIIQSWKDKGLTPEKIGKSISGEHGSGATAASIYPLYQRRLKALNAMDFGDLLLHCLTLFTEHPHILAEYTHRFHYVLVDEYQDTNVAQYLWLRLLAQGYKNICCVGDDDQSIYGWRGAEVGNILKFEKDFPEAQTVRLERNYRSTPPILAAASGLIANNESRLGKTLFTDVQTGGDPLRIKSVWDDSEEARFIGEEVESYQRDGESLDEMAILVRAGFQTRAFEERFITLGVAYKVVGGLRFYERLEIRDVIAYLRLVHQPADDLAFERIINTPKRGIGKTTLEKLHSLAREKNCSLHEALSQQLEAGALKGKAAGSLKEFMAQLERWRGQSQSLPLPEVAEQILEESGYKAMWQQDKTPEAPGRVENIRELVRALAEFESFSQFLEHISLVMERADSDVPEAMVSIMTLHASKGLEFNVVFLAGWEEGLFPSQRTMDESGKLGLEEERRLAYVGITRARKQCIISHAANRRIYNQWQSSIPSRFLQELPEEHIEILDGGVYSKRASAPALYQRGIDGLQESRAPAMSHAPSVNGIHKGQQVHHAKFGPGVVLKMEGDHLTIAFKHAGTKKVMADYVEKA
jgi:DNA helicase-2/ATP-dependent DNA helicase PcrA